MAGLKVMLKFERDSLVFTAGEKVKGTLIFEGEKTAKIYDLQLLLTGVIRQSAYYRPYVENKRHLADYCNGDLTVHHTHKVASSDNGILLPQRTKIEVPFEMQLPLSLWSTFIGTLGYTIYRIMILLRSNNQFAGIDGFLIPNEIVIVGYVNPIKDGFDIPLTHTKTCTIKSGESVNLTVTLEKSCTSPGEMFNFRVDIENGLKLPLATVKMVFQQNIFYAFKRRLSSQLINKRIVNEEANILVQKEGPTIAPGPGRKLSWSWGFEVPHVAPSGMGAEGCKLIHVSYGIFFVLSKFVNLRLTLPIHIGTRAALSQEDWESASVAYVNELRRSLSETSLDSWSIMNNNEDSWSSFANLRNESPPGEMSRASSSLSMVSSSTITGPPSYKSEWDFSPVETPPPKYQDIVDEDSDED